MPSNYTTNYQLNQWSKSDRVLMDEFNADNAKIDAALAGLSSSMSGNFSALSQTVAQHTASLSGKGNCQIQLSSYSGNGAETRTHTFSRRPLLVVILSDMSLVAVQGSPKAVHTLGGGNTYILETAWSGNSVTLSYSGQSTSDIARVVANTSGRTYYMVAFFDAAA